MKIPKIIKCALDHDNCIISKNGYGSCGDGVCFIKNEVMSYYCIWIDNLDTDVVEWQEVDSNDLPIVK